MRTIGVIAEYNPFHSGHRYHLDTIRRDFGADCGIVCVMSGNFVQRGEPAILDKWARAGMALRGGADLILELPTLWACSSAETFAHGGVSLLEATGVVDTLSFGSESGSLSSLQAVADCLESPAWQTALRLELKKGVSFPTARQKAAETLLGETAACLHQPNNNLGIAYLRAIKTLTPHTIRRQGAGHDSEDGTAAHVSGSYLREQILSLSPTPLSPYLDWESEALLRRDPASLRFCERAVLARLRMMTEADFAKLPDSGEGLSHRLFRGAQVGNSMEEVMGLVKSKRYPLARIRRLLLWAFLGLQETDRPELPPYLRVLGFNAKGQTLLRAMKTQAALPVLVKPAHASKLSPEAQRVFALESRCTALYDLCRMCFGEREGKREYTEGPVMLCSATC